MKRKIVHLLRSEKDETTRLLIAGVSENQESIEVDLNSEVVDYDNLVKDIFESEQVICWW